MSMYDKAPEFDKWFEGYLEELRERKRNPPPPPPPLSPGLLAAAARHEASEGTVYQQVLDKLAIHEDGPDGWDDKRGLL